MSEGLKLFESRFASLFSRVRSLPASEEPLAPWRNQTPDPERLLVRWLDGVVFPDDSAIALSGVGDGAHIEALLKKMPENGQVFCAEPDASRFRAFLNTPRAERLLRESRVSFGVGQLDEAFFSSLGAFSVLDVLNAEPLIFSPLFVEAEEYYESFFTGFAQHLDVYRKLYGTNLTKSGLWQGNSIRNLPALIRSPDPSELHEVFEGVPMVVAGAGPSLDESLEFLRWAQDRVVIVAGNSSIRALVNAGVRPHFVLAADPNPSTDSGFEGVDLGDTVLVCPFLVYPGVVKRFDGRATAWARDNVFARYFRKATGANILEHVTEQGTVSACAFDLARILGCPSLYFVGQDLAARTDGKLHASDSFYQDEGLDNVNLEECRWCPGNTIEKVPVEEKLFVYLKAFEQLSQIYSKELKLKGGKRMELYNLSRLGARVENMPYLPFDDAKARLESAQAEQLAKGWKRTQAILAGYSVGWGRVGKALREFRSYIEEICSFSLKQALALEMGGQDLGSTEKAKRDLESKISANREFEEMLRDGQLNMELYVHARSKALRDRKGVQDSDAVQLEVLMDYFWAVAEGSYHVLSSLDAAKEKARP